MPNIYDVVEQDILLNGTFADPFNDVAIDVTLTLFVFDALKEVPVTSSFSPASVLA